MPRIIPIKELKNTAAVSQLCHETQEPIYVTKNGYGDMVIMSMKTYEEKMKIIEVYRKLPEAEKAIKDGEVVNPNIVLHEQKEKYHER